jgi:hypothetical protein
MQMLIICICIDWDSSIGYDPGLVGVFERANITLRIWTGTCLRTDCHKRHNFA